MKRGDFVKVKDETHPNYGMYGVIIRNEYGGRVVEHFENVIQKSNLTAGNVCLDFVGLYNDEQLKIAKPDISRVKAGDVVTFKKYIYPDNGGGRVALGNTLIPDDINLLSGVQAIVDKVKSSDGILYIWISGDEHSYPITAFQNKLNTKKMSAFRVDIIKLNKTSTGILLEIRILTPLQKALKYFALTQNKPINDKNLKSIVRYKIVGEVAHQLAQTSYLLFSKELISSGVTRMLFKDVLNVQDFVRNIERDVAYIVASYLQRKKYFKRI